MHLVGFIIRIYHDARSSECQMLISNPITSMNAKSADQQLNKLQNDIFKPMLTNLVSSYSKDCGLCLHIRKTSRHFCTDIIPELTLQKHIDLFKS